MAGPATPGEIAPGVYRASGGPRTNVYFVRSGHSWVVVDTGWAGKAAALRSQAEAVFGPGARPAGILLTHIHPDHSGSAAELARDWDVPVYVHPAELPMAAPDYPVQYMNPVDRRIGATVALARRIRPSRPRQRLRTEGDLRAVVRGLDPQDAPPGLPDWECVPTPGHTPGHVAFHRRGDRVLITGDAVLTLDANSVLGIASGRQRLSGPPRWFTWSWPSAMESIGALVELAPRVLATGHGRPLMGEAVAAALTELAQDLTAKSERSAGTRAGRLGQVGEGFIRPVMYGRRARYRRPPRAYLRLQWLGFLLTRLGLSPSYVITLEVPGRRSGIIRRTNLATARHEGAVYLVALGGESEWVRNVRAAGGRVVISRKQRRAATLVEIAPEDRAPILRSYVLRSGRRTGSSAVSKEARACFGVSPDLSLSELARVAEYYPVFRIVQDERQAPSP